jgi:ATP-binding cassette subfamily F protein uup
MALISVKNLSLSFGGEPLFDGIDLHIEEGDRLCLLGRNGTGKSTLLKLMAGLIEADAGEITRERGLRAAYLAQDFPEKSPGLLLDLVSGGRVERHLAAEQALSLVGLEGGREFGSLSGGEKRRAQLARVLAAEADVLFLDEPTNHLDIDTISFMEEHLLRRVKTFIFVTHDRSFAKNLSNRVAEIDRGRLWTFRTDYDDFLQRREELLTAERKQRAEFDKKLAREEAWLRRGVKARRTRNEGRVSALEKMREEYRSRRDLSGQAKMEIHAGDRSGKVVVEVKNLSFRYDGDAPDLIRNFSTTIMRQDRVGIVGPNGSGKTSLLRLLLKELEPVSGSVRHGANLQPVYYDQMREELDPDRTVAENLGEGYDTIFLNGRKKHILAYLQDFLFSPERAKSPVAHLSGGERNRLMLAKLFSRPSNLLVLDEPTNDLDMETLELLEDLLQEYPGTILLVSHDRTFLDNVVTDCFVLAGEGRVIEYAGGYADWADSELRRKTQENLSGGAARGTEGAGGAGGVGGAGKRRADTAVSMSAAEKRRAAKPKTEKARRLSFREQRELEELPNRIAVLEEEKDRIHGELSDPALYQSPGGDPGARARRLEEVEKELAAAYERWEYLDSSTSTSNSKGES